MPIANIILKLWVAGFVDPANSNWFSCIEEMPGPRQSNLALRWQLHRQRQRQCLLRNWYPLIGLFKIGLPFGYLGKPKHRLVTIVFHCVFPFTNAPDVQSCSAMFFTRAIQVGLFEKWLHQNLVVARISCC